MWSILSEKGFWGKARNTHLRKNMAISRARDSNSLVWVINFYRGTVARGWNRGGVRSKIGDFVLVFLMLALCQFLSCYFLQTRKQAKCTGWVADELLVLHFRCMGFSCIPLTYGHFLLRLHVPFSLSPNSYLSFI